MRMKFLVGPVTIRQDFRLKECGFRLDVKKVISYNEDGGMLEQAGQEK